MPAHLDRLQLRHGLADLDVAARRERVFELLEEAEVVGSAQVILARAAQPFPTELGTLDPIHLASALAWARRGRRRSGDGDHDAALATAARASGLLVVGPS